MSNINFTDLESKGYVVIPNFLTPEKIASLVEEYLHEKENMSIRNKNYKIYSRSSPSFLKNDLTQINELIRDKTNITTTFINYNMIFFINSLINFGWHQDHESYYMTQDSYNHLKCWIPIIKPNSNKSGLRVIPHDKLLEKCPDFFKNHILGKGASRFVELYNGNTLVECGETNEILTLDFKISDLEYIPVLSPGDLLLMRGDLIHRSQTSEDFRVAIHLDILNTNAIINKEKFYNSGTVKKNYIKNNPEQYKTLIELFEKQDFVTVGELT